MWPCLAYAKQVTLPVVAMRIQEMAVSPDEYALHHMWMLDDGGHQSTGSLRRSQVGTP